MPAITAIAHGLQFPEGPVAMPGGSVVLMEIERQTLSRVHPNGAVLVLAELGGGPNSAAIGPDGRCYVCNNGGFEWHRRGETVLPGLQSTDYHSGSIQAVRIGKTPIRRLLSRGNTSPSTTFDHFFRGVPPGTLPPTCSRRRIPVCLRAVSAVWAPHHPPIRSKAP
jgi:hypothetical protein